MLQIHIILIDIHLSPKFLGASWTTVLQPHKQQQRKAATYMGKYSVKCNRHKCIRKKKYIAQTQNTEVDCI